MFSYYRYQMFQNVEIVNFTNSWSNGLAFCALIHHFFPQVIVWFSVGWRARYHCTFCRHLTSRNWQETIENTISSWHSQPESKWIDILTAWNIYLTFVNLSLSHSQPILIRRLAGIPDFISGDDMDEMISSGRLDPKVVFAYVQEVYRALKDN